MAPPKVGKQHFCKHYHSAKNDADGRSRREVRLAFWRTWVNLRGVGEACTNRLHHSPSADAKAPQHRRQSKTQRHRQPIQQPKQMYSHKNARRTNTPLHIAGGFLGAAAHIRLKPQDYVGRTMGSAGRPAALASTSICRMRSHSCCFSSQSRFPIRSMGSSHACFRLPHASS